MNMAVTSDVDLMPRPFEEGLQYWSSQEGTPGSDTYLNSATAAFVSADQDFGGCLELQKTQATTRVRYTQQTPITPGCYLRITARLKCLAGNFPSVRISGWPGRADDTQVIGIQTFSQEETFTSYGSVLEVSKIVASAARDGVDMAWGIEPTYGYFGIDLTGPDGAIVRIDDIEIEDVSAAFQGELLGRVDVRDYGALGDGVTDDRDAFNAADNAAEGREIFVPQGTFLIASSLTIDNPIYFSGTLLMPREAQLTLRKDFHLPAYAAAFGDEVEGFKKAFQALMDFSDYDSLDMRGMQIDLSEPLDMASAVPEISGFSVRRVIRNGQFQALDTPQWESDEVTVSATYDPEDSRTLTNVQNIAQIAVGSHISGFGVGREIYVRAKNEIEGSLTISQPFYGGAGVYTLTFRRFKYLLDFSGFTGLSKFNISDVELRCQGRASGIMLAPAGNTFHVRDCFISQIKDRGVTSIGSGCQDLMLDRCQFTCTEQNLPATQRTALVFNTNANDLKLRDNRVQRFKHFGVIGGTSSIVTGNHLFMGDDETDGARPAGLIYSQANAIAAITGNYIDNCFIEWTNEWEPEPDFANQYSFTAMTITGNTFFAIDVASDFNFIKIKPYGGGHFIHGLSIVGNVFLPINGNIRRIEGIDTTFADLNYWSMRNINVIGNTFNAVDEPIFNPTTVTHTQQSESTVWSVDFNNMLPFNGAARVIEGVVPIGPITSGGQIVTQSFYTERATGSLQNQIEVRLPVASKGAVSVTARMDNPR